MKKLPDKNALYPERISFYLLGLNRAYQNYQWVKQHILYTKVRVFERQSRGCSDVVYNLDTIHLQQELKKH